ncbi:MAG TPA: S8 family serine peptidase, partial [Thermoguttaceae bacterium]|nr:S8 family serine peptidase [Thermoguttaceae bacterium]
FDLTVLDDAEYDGVQRAVVVAGALGMNDGSGAVNVRDDDAHHFAFDAIGGVRTIGEPFGVTVRAKDVRGETIEVAAGTVSLGGRTAGSTASTVVISEVDTESPDRMEFTNVSSANVDISGWQVFVYDRIYPTSPRPAYTFPADTICPAGGVFTLQQNGTAPGTYPTFYTGDDISWRPYSPTGVLLLDDAGAVVDFVAASALDPAAITDPVTLVPDFWQGAAVPAQADYSVTYQRVGGSDTNGQSDWILRGSSAGTINPGMTLPFADQPISIPVTPLTAVELVGGVWTGEVSVEALSTGVMLTAAAGRGLSGTSNAFDVEPGPVDRFGFSSIASPRYADRPIGVTLTALDAYGNTATSFNDTVDLSGWTAAGASSIVVTECGLDGPDYIEIQNVSDREIDTSGWIVAVSDDYDDVNVANALTWSLPPSIPAGDVLHRTDDEGPNYWQGNIHWGAGNPGWAVILDDAREIVDFVAWGWTASDLAEMNAVIDGHNLTPGDQFTGDGVPLIGTDSIQRQGNEDRNSAADFSWAPPESMGVQNTGLSVPFPGESTPVAVTPAVTASFTDGVWTGDVYVPDVLGDVYLQADDGNGHVGSSDTFDALRFYSEIRGGKFLDRDGDGVWDPEEEGLEGWQIYLDENLNGRWDAGEPTTLTDVNGEYAFTGLLPGTYTVAEVARDDWVQTYPRDNPLGERAAEPRLEITTTASDAPVYVASQPVPAGGDSDLLPETNVSGSLVGIDLFRADPRFAGIDGSGFATVILDTGIAVDHPFFGPDQDGDGVADRIVYQWDYADNDGDASDTKWAHGSTIASIAASGDATYTGMAPGADIIFFKIFPDSGDSSFAYVESALQWVIDHAAEYNIASVNMSFTDGENFTTFVNPYGIGDELAQLAAMNVIVVSAAGNAFYTYDSAQGESYPAADAHSLSVGGVYVADYGRRSYGSGAVANTTAADRIAPYSQRHETMTTVFAPSGKVTGAGKDTPARATTDGTSAAAPHVAGIAALAQQLAVRELGRRLTTDEFISLLRQTGAVIHDGDDEDDNVVNTDADFPRVDAFALGEEILRLAAMSRAHSVVLAQGEVIEDVDFGNRPETKIADRHVFYNRSAFDGNDAEANAADDDAVAVDKEALLPGESAAFAHYTSFSRGINGIMVDVAHATRTPTAADFLFKVGNNNDPATWTPISGPGSVAVREGAGTGGSDRVTILFEDGAVKNQWLEVTVLAGNLGLDRSDVFYFGNAVGEAGNSPTNAQVTVIDMLLARNNPRSLINPAPIDFFCDYNRDARVNATDVLLARNNPTGFQSTLKLINLSGQGYGGPAQAAEGPGTEASAAALVPAGWFAEDLIESDDTPAGTAWLRDIEPLTAKGRESRESTVARRIIDDVFLAAFW